MSTPTRLRSGAGARRLSPGLAAMWLLAALAIPAYTQSHNNPVPSPDMPPKQPGQERGVLASALASQPMTEDAFQHTFTDKIFYLRDGFLDNTLNFDQEGKLEGSSPRGSFTLGLVQINKVRLTKKKLELEGIRYGLHFLGALPTEELSENSDKVRITPKKKLVRITVEREQVVKAKKSKKGKSFDKDEAIGRDEPPTTQQNAQVDDMREQSITIADSTDKTTSQEQADKLLRKALDRIFAPEIDTHLIAAMPDYWQRYFEATASQKNETSDEAGVSAPTNVDQRARLIAPIEPASNDFAQNAGIAGMAMYHAVIDAAGKAGAIAVARPIGFGLDENAVEAIHQAKFEPAIKDGKAVPVWVDVIVQFRIYSKRTNVPGQPAGDAARQKTLPGPYSVGQQ